MLTELYDNIQYIYNVCYIMSNDLQCIYNTENNQTK